MTRQRPRHATGTLLLAVVTAAAACQARPAPSTSAAGATPAVTAAAAPLPTPPGLANVGGTFVAPVEACRGARPWNGVPALVARLADAWHEHDYAARRAILDAVWAEDGVYEDPYGGQARGRDAFAALMGYGVAPGQYIELRRWHESDVHHGTIRLTWRHCCPSGVSLLEGTDIATIGLDGRFSRIISFWTRYVEGPAEGACDGPPSTAAPGVPSATPDVAATCKGPDVDWSALPPVAQGYGKAWNERDPAARDALLEEVWAEDGTFADVYTAEGSVVAGREAFSANIDGFLEAGFGAYFEPLPTTGGDVHDDFLRLPWTYCDADDEVVWVGEDIVELGPDGRIVDARSFFVP